MYSEISQHLERINGKGLLSLPKVLVQKKLCKSFGIVTICNDHIPRQQLILPAAKPSRA